MISRPKDRLAPEEVLSLVLASLAALLLFGVGVGGARLFQATQNRTVRCYSLSPPLTQQERAILEDGVFACSSQLCRITLRPLPAQGIACYFPQLSSQTGAIFRYAAQGPERSSSTAALPGTDAPLRSAQGI